jgi:hypothetical protein
LSTRGTLTLLNNVLLSAHFHIADQLPKTLKNVSALISSAERQSANLTIVEGPRTRILGFIIPMVFGTLPGNFAMSANAGADRKVLARWVTFLCLCTQGSRSGDEE